MTVLTFASLSGAAIIMRRRTEWHRRLHYCGMSTLLGPAVGRLLPMPLLIPYAWYIGTVLLPLLFPVIGMLADKKRYGAVHPAWLWGIGIVLGLQVVADLLAYSSVGVAITDAVLAGSPGAERPITAYLP